MVKVNSVLGLLDTADFGYTLAHEHIMVNSAGIQQTFPELIDRQGSIEQSVKDLTEAYNDGLRTIVDLTTHDLGRDIRLIEEVSRRSGVQVIACTGTWLDIPRAFISWTQGPENIAPLYIREIEEGIEGTGIRAGIIKVASDGAEVTPQEEVILRAAALAHKATGIPISTHTSAQGNVGAEQIKILTEAGVDPGRIYVGHSNDNEDVDYLLSLLNQGVWLGLDRYPGGYHKGTPKWERRTEVAKQLIDAGFSNRIMLAHDWAVILDNEKTPAWRKERLEDNPHHYLFINRVVIPRLRKMGVSDEVIHQIMLENTRSFFDGG